MDGIDLVELQGLAGCRTQERGIFATAGGDWLQRRGVMTLESPRSHEPAGEESLADAGVRAGNEEAGHEGRVELRT